MIAEEKRRYVVEVMHVTSNLEETFRLVPDAIEHYKKHGVKGIVDENVENTITDAKLPTVEYKTFEMNTREDADQMLKLCDWFNGNTWKSTQKMYTQCSEKILE